MITNYDWLPEHPVCPGQGDSSKHPSLGTSGGANTDHTAGNARVPAVAFQPDKRTVLPFRGLLESRKMSVVFRKSLWQNYAPTPWSEENLWNKLCEMNAARGTFVPYFFICFLVSWGHWNVKFCNLASILPLPYTALTNSQVEPRETAKARFLGFSWACCDDTFPVGPSSQPTIWSPPLVLSSVSGK